MDDYIVVADDAVHHVVRTSDWVVIATSTSSTFALLVAGALN